ncbi:MAG: glycosyl hydrolase, partial [Chitinophagaceae bacterium]
MNKFFLLALTIFFVGSNLQAQTKISAPDLSPSAFSNPSQKFGIRCWWWWLNGNVTKTGITKDLEAMHSQGFSGACIFDAGGQNQQGNGDVPEGPMFGSPAWTALFLHAVSEAKRLNLVLSLNIQSGWNLGAPDTKLEESAKKITWSEVIGDASRLSGIMLPAPPSEHAFYRDIAVLAYPYSDTSSIVPLKNQKLKAAFSEIGGSAGDTRFLIEQESTSTTNVNGHTKQVIDISKYLGADGKLSWKAPPGKWVVMR